MTEGQIPRGASRTPKPISSTSVAAPQAQRPEAPPLLPSISLPKGGGAIRGIGEKFSSNPATGTGSLSIPLAASPGRSGFDLGLQLNYDSGAGNGSFGIGWHLSTPSVTRKTDKGLPRYRDAEGSDVFVLSGAEDLVPIRVKEEKDRLDAFDRGDYRVQRYRPRAEGLFARIERWTHRVTSEAHWRAITRDNVLNVYGRSADARIADPERPERVFSWLLEETRDDRGNVARYRYKPEDSAGVDPRKASESNRFETRLDGSASFLTTAQRYLKRIEYGNRVPVREREAPAPASDDAHGLVGVANWLFEVVFDYGEHDEVVPTPAEARAWPIRSDPFSSFRSTFEVRTYRLCRRVLMFHRFAELGAAPCLVRSTDFSYEQGGVVTYLAAATQVGYRRASGSSTYERASLPPLELGYVKPEVHAELRNMDAASLEGVPGGIDGTGGQWVDLDGEGISGVLIPTERAWFYKPNLGAGKLGPPVLERQLPAPAELRGGAQQLSDLGGDGNLDLVRYAPPLSGFFERTPDKKWAPFVALPHLPNIDWNDPNLRFLDIDGDGFPDALITEQDALVWYRSRAKDGFEPATSVRKAQEERKGPTVVFADGTETIQLADMSGDGLVDIVRVRHSEVCYWPNLGYGRFGRKITLDRSPHFDTPDCFDPRRIRFADIDGSGTSDIVYLGRDGVRLYFNESGNGFTPETLLESLPSVDSVANLSVVDLLGQGTACLVLSNPLSRGKPVVYLEILGWRREDGSIEHGKKPHVLDRIVNNLGAETRIAYASSTKFYLQDKAAGRPWLTRLPFPVQVIERIERYDYIAQSKLVTRFAYHHGYFDGHEREFRGFACVEQWDTESLSGDKGRGLFPEIPYDVDPTDAHLNLPPVRTVTWFHTGAWLERERLELALSKEYYGNDPGAEDPRAAEFFLEDTVFELELAADGTPVPLSLREEREATRALRGCLLRQELYAEDGTPAAGHPYSVSERNYQVRCVQRAPDGGHGVFFAHPLHTLSLHYERHRDDPRIQHEILLALDEFGNIECSAVLAYPRRERGRAQQELSSGQTLNEQKRAWITVSERSYANRSKEADWYRIGVSVESQTSELTGVPLPSHGVLSHAALLSALGGAREIAYESVPGSGVERRVIERQRALYYRDYDTLEEFRDDALGPLPVGEVTQRALPHQLLQLAFTPGFLAQVFETRVTASMLTAEGGYVDQDGGWWAASGRTVFDPEKFYLAVESVDPFAQRQFVRYDSYDLLVLDTEDALHSRLTAGLRDAAGGITSNGNDYRTLAPALLCDPNRNRTLVEFDALGMVVKQWQMGREGTSDGDGIDQAGVLLRHDLHAWRERRGPAFVHVATREVHRSGGDPFDPAGAPERRGFQHVRTYSDGFGREVLKKTQAEPGPVPIVAADGHLQRNPDGTPALRLELARWVGSGRIVYDNKGNPIKQYEPFFSARVEYEDEKELVEWGVTALFRYDPLGRLVRTDRPNGSRCEVRFDAWKEATWDENDLVLASEWYEQRGAPDPSGPEPVDAQRRAAWLAARHAATPTVAHLDALGRAFLTLADNGQDEQGRAQLYATRVELDIEGNQRAVTDARGNRALEQIFDVLGRSLYTKSADAGESRTVVDIAGRRLYEWDARGYEVRRTYDALRRPEHVFVRQGVGPSRLVELTVYGERHPQAELRNLIGRAYQVYDGAGALTNVRFDFKGNGTDVARQVPRDYRAPPDWSGLAALGSIPAIESASSALLEPERFTISIRFDALNRIVSRTTPDSSEARITYNQSGLLESIDVVLAEGAEPSPFVGAVTYNARGQRELIEYANQTSTRYAYESETFRLSRQTTSGAGGGILQDLAYTYDPVGNLVAIGDAVSYGNPGVSAGGSYWYDPLYRLSRAEGREHPGQQASSEDAAILGLPPAAHPNDWQALRRYRESYLYDPVGNLVQISHQRVEASTNGWSRRYQYSQTSNRLIGTSAPAEPPGTFSAKYVHDASGNMTQMPHLPELEWDHGSRLRRVSKQVQNAGGPPNAVHFAYDAAGRRVRKTYEHSGLVEDRIYVGAYEVYRRRNGGTGALQLERQTLHVMDDQTRVALLETKTTDTAVPGFVPSARVRFQLANHIGAAAMELDADGEVISYEEYHPFGNTAFRAADASVDVSAKTYRYGGKERDEETALYYYGARYYAPWLGRWTSADPAGLVDGPCTYAYARNNPMNLRDRNGMQAGPWTPYIRMQRAGDLFNAAADAVKSTATSIAEQVVEGDFHKGETTWGGVVANVGVGLIPIVGQAADARDTIANGKNVWNSPSSGAAWGGLGMAAVGWIPLFGDSLKGAGKVGKKVGAEVLGAETKVAKALATEGKAAKQFAENSVESFVSLRKQAKQAISEKTLESAENVGTLVGRGGRQQFREAVTEAISTDPSHPLSFLLGETGGLTKTTTKGTTHAVMIGDSTLVEMGHAVSSKSGGDAMILMSAYKNRIISSTIEHPSKGGSIIIDEALDIGGVAVDKELALDWIGAGLINSKVLEGAKRVSLP
jgi:RHS repeat-associated protein